MEAIRISMAGFPTRKPFKEFINRFKIFAPDEVTKSNDDIKTSKMLLEKANLKGYQIGKTKVFLRAGQIGRCRYESRKREVATLRIQKDGRMFVKRKAFKNLAFSAIKIQNGMRGMAARNEYRYKRRETTAVILQTQCRQYLAQHRYRTLKKATITTQSFWRARLARKELKHLRLKAKDTDTLQAAKSKLEKEVEELTWRLQVEKRIRAGLEETKNQENAKWQSVFKEMQEQSEQTKELLHKEVEAAKKELEEARADKEASSKEIVDKLTTENENLK
ncbi:hypothetical protein M8C21_013892, partial [Ambrosia artemisiifolia]